LFGDKREKLAKLTAHHRKLSELVGDILEKTDQIDRSLRDKPRKMSAEWQSSFAKAVQEAVHLSEAVAGIDTLLKKGDVKASEKALLRSAEIAKHIFEKLDDLGRGVT
jgi:hypothetical protein